MPDVAVLRAIVEGDDSQFNRVMERVDRRMMAAAQKRYPATKYPAPDTKEALNRLKAVDSAILKLERRKARIGLTIQADPRMLKDLSRYTAEANKLRDRKATITINKAGNASLSELRNYASVIKRLNSKAIVISIGTGQASQNLRDLQKQLQAIKGQMGSIRAPRGGAGAGGAGYGGRRSALEYRGYNDVMQGAIISRAFTEPGLRAGLGVLRAGIDWETAYTGVRKTVDATPEQHEVIARALRDQAAGSNPIPVKVEELAGLAEAAGQLGIKTKDITGFTRVMADLGATTNLASQQAAEQLARLSQIVGMPQDSFDRLGSTIVDLGNKFAATEKEIVDRSFRLAGAGKQVGMSAADITAFANGLASIGVRSDAGGSSFSKLFLGMDKAVREGGEDLALFSKVAGTSSQEFAEAFRRDAASAVVDFIEGLGRMQKSGADVAGTLKELHLSEIRVRDALLRSAAAGDLFRNSLDTANQAWKENTALSAEAAKRYETTASKLQILSNRMKEQVLLIAEEALPAANALIDTYGDELPQAIGAASRGFAALPAPIQKTAIGLAVLLALVGPMKIAAGNAKLLGSAIGGIGAITLAPLVKHLGAVVALLPAVKSLGDLTTLGGMAVGGATGVATGGIVAASAVLAYELASIAIYNYTTSVNDADLAAHNAKMGTDALAKSLGRLDDFTRGGQGGYKKVFEEMRTGAALAGRDVHKLGALLDQMEAEQVKIGADMKLDPTGKFLALNETRVFVNQIKSMMRELGVNLEVREAFKQFEKLNREALKAERLQALVRGDTARADQIGKMLGVDSAPAPTGAAARPDVRLMKDKQLFAEKKRLDDLAKSGYKFNNGCGLKPSARTTGDGKTK